MCWRAVTHIQYRTKQSQYLYTSCNSKQKDKLLWLMWKFSFAHNAIRAMNESTQTYNTYTYIGPCGAFAISPQIRMLYIAEVKHRMEVVASQCKRMPNTWHTPLCRQAVAYFVVCFFLHGHAATHADDSAGRHRGGVSKCGVTKFRPAAVTKLIVG